MNIVYYYDPNLKSSPVKRYLNQFDLGVAKDLALLAAIDSKIIFLSCQKSHPHPPISKPLHDYNFFEIRHRKNKNILIRVIYFCCDERMILLNAFEKPDNYDSQKINYPGAEPRGIPSAPLTLRGRKSLFIASAPLRYATGSHSSPRQSRRGILADK